MSGQGRVFSRWMGLKAIELNELIGRVFVDNPEKPWTSHTWE